MIRIGKKAFDTTVVDDLLVYGHSKICAFPEFSDQENLEGIYRIVEDKNVLNSILSDAMESQGLYIKIGNEIAYDGLEQCSVVSSTYGNDDYLLGSIGIVGPTRMNYSMAISAIDYSAQKLSWAVGKFLNSD
jgi:heat-inducible transcriptional repressor